MVFPQSSESFTHSSHGNWKMRMVRYTDCNSVNFLAHFIKHLSKILELRNSIEFFCPCRMTCTHRDITQGHRINMFRIVHIMCNASALSPASNESDVHFFICSPKTLPGIKLKTELAAAALVNFLRVIFLVMVRVSFENLIGYVQYQLYLYMIFVINFDVSKINLVALFYFILVYLLYKFSKDSASDLIVKWFYPFSSLESHLVPIDGL